MIVEKVKNTVKKYRLLDKNDKVVVAVSGGPDSVTLLYLLNGLKKELNLTLHVAHLDHMLRKDSHKDAEFVSNLASKLKIPITTAQVNIKELAKKGSLEEIARNARLGFLFRVAKEIKAKKVALGHSLDDQSETVLMRILRGTGLYGLSGILPKRVIAGYQIIRPLIEVKRKEITAYLKRKKIHPRQDPTNAEDIYFRNKIRNNLLPLLEKGYNRNIKELLANMAESVGTDYDYLNYLARHKIKGAKTKISLKRLSKMHPAIQRLIFRNAIACVKGDTRRITFRHIKEIEDLFLNRPFKSIVDLPKRVSVIKSGKHLSFYSK
jgi:tRNA(Ile)-lysidine synthase